MLGIGNTNLEHPEMEDSFTKCFLSGTTLAGLHLRNLGYISVNLVALTICLICMCTRGCHL